MLHLTGDDIRRAIIKSSSLPQDAAVGVVSMTPTEQRADRAKRLVWVTATTSDIDSDREVVVPGGCDPASRFFSLKSCFVDHKYDHDHFFGKMRKALPKMGAGGEQSGWTVQFEVYPLKSAYADDILTIAERGELSVSIGLQGLDYGKTTTAEKTKYMQGGAVPTTIVRKWNWLELSSTMMPANLKCRQIGYGEELSIDAATMKRLDIFDNMLVKGEIKRETADAMGFSALTQRRANAQLATQLHLGRGRGIILLDG